MKATTMVRRTLASAAIAAMPVVMAGAITGGTALAAEMAHKAAAAEPGAGHTAEFGKIKKLAGDWTMDGQGDKVAVSYKLTAQGTAVVETLFPGAPFEMVTVYHMDGKDLMLTHYCGDGNQPRMKAAPTGADGTLSFKFAGATGMKSANDTHMHDMSMTFVDDDHVKASWTSYSGGKKSDVKEFNLTRKKA
jgi:hypothetical protein